jgi:hypothetical protein
MVKKKRMRSVYPALIKWVMLGLTITFAVKVSVNQTINNTYNFNYYNVTNIVKG